MTVKEAMEELTEGLEEEKEDMYCAFCHNKIYAKSEYCQPGRESGYYMYTDNFLQRKYFDEIGGSDNVFCSESCACKALMLEHAYIEDRECWEEASGNEEIYGNEAGTDKAAESGYVRGFQRHNKAWYAEANGLKTGNITFGMYAKEGGTTGEIAVEWIELCGEKKPRMSVFSDAYAALASFGDLTATLAREKNVGNITEDRFAEILLECGFSDLTAYRKQGKTRKRVTMEEISE
jgi:hypothetical protein